MPLQLLDLHVTPVSAFFPQIRYRDDHVVTHSGAKSITLHDPADDYDGGSHGTVKTKGKRGPGSVKC